MIQKSPTPQTQVEIDGLDQLHVRSETEAAVLSPEAISQISGVTHALFGGAVAVNTSRDPEYPAEEYLVFAVAAALSPGDIVHAECEWIRQVEAIVPNCDSLRLSIRAGYLTR